MRQASAQPDITFLYRELVEDIRGEVFAVLKHDVVLLRHHVVVVDDLDEVAERTFSGGLDDFTDPGRTDDFARMPLQLVPDVGEVL